jgi:hypothetical protein
MALRSRDAFETRPLPLAGRSVEEAGGSPYLLAPFPEDPRAAQVLSRADGRSSVDEIAERLGITSDMGWRRLVGLLRYLWWNNALTWLPPVGP